MSVSALVRWGSKLRGSIARRGFRSTLRLTFKTLSFRLVGNSLYSPWSVAFQERLFDRKYGVDTSGTIEIKDLSVANGNRAFAQSYVGSDSELFAEMLGRLRIRFEEFTFVDLGSGKGRVLLQASRYPFRRIIGVEFSPELHAIGQRNIEAFRPVAAECREISSVCADAARYEFPDGNLLIYLFNPFQAPVMRRVLQNLHACLRNTAREAWLLYLRPTAGEVFGEFPFLEKIDHSDYARAWYTIYRAVPAAGAPGPGKQGVNRLHSVNFE